MQVKIIRLEKGKAGCFGALLMDDECTLLTLEPPDLSNIPAISCIPEGAYVCSRYTSSKHGETFQIIEPFPDRDYILFHVGNTKCDTKGCVLLGKSFGIIDGERGLTGSKEAFKVFMDRLKNETMFRLVIT